MQLTRFIAAALFAASSVLAQPPSCLLAALDTQTNPADIKGICQNSASSLQKSIQSDCGGDTNTALSSFASTCQGVGVKVPTVSASSTTNGTTNGTASGTSSGASGSSSSGTKNEGGRLSSGLLSVAIAGIIGGATFVL